MVGRSAPLNDDVGQDARKGPEDIIAGRVRGAEKRPRLGARIRLELGRDRGDLERAQRFGVSQPDEVAQERFILNLLHRLVIAPVRFSQRGRAEDAARGERKEQQRSLQRRAATGSMKSSDRP